MALLDNRSREENKQQLEEIKNDLEQEEEHEEELLEDIENEGSEEDDQEENEGSEDEEESEDDGSEDESEDDEENREPSKLKPQQEDPNPLDKRYLESSREAIILNERNKKMTSAVEQAAAITEVTDEEIVAAYPGVKLDEVPAYQIQMMKDAILNKKKFEAVHNVVAQSKKLDEWIDSVDAFLSDPDTKDLYPHLRSAENKEAFKRFAIKETHRGVDMELLAKTFAFDLPKKEKKRGSLFATASGGAPAPSKKYLNEEDAAILRRKSPKKYREYIKAGKIKVNI